MADTSANPFSSRYAEIDKAYREQRWATVLEQGELLLRELGGAGETDAAGLRQRVQLLMAHTHLYGYGDPDAAEDLYGAVLTSKAETSLRQIAEQGIRRCELPLDRRPGEKAAEERRARAAARQRPASSTPIAEVAQPVPIAPDLEAAEADTSPQPVLEATDRQDDIGGLATAAGGLSEQPAAHRPDAGAPAAGTGLPAFLVNLASAQAAATPAETPGGGSGGGGGQPALPWLQSPPATESVAAGSAAAGSAAAESVTAAEPTASVTLVPDVVEEPELIEVHQADPLLAEEVEPELASPVRGITRQATRVSPRPAARIEEDPDLMAGLLEVTIG